MSIPIDPLYERTGMKVRYSPGCPYNKPARITNADRIRVMTDEEIENWYWWLHKEMTYYTDSYVFVHDWLKQEVEE